MNLNHTSKEIDSTSIATTAPGMPASRQRTVWARNSAPLIFVNDVDEQIIKEGGKSSVVVLATEQK